MSKVSDKSAELKIIRFMEYTIDLVEFFLSSHTHTHDKNIMYISFIECFLWAFQAIL